MRLCDVFYSTTAGRDFLAERDKMREEIESLKVQLGSFRAIRNAERKSLGDDAAEKIGNDTRELLVRCAFACGEISIGRAAELLGCSLVDCREKFHAEGVEQGDGLAVETIDTLVDQKEQIAKLQQRLDENSKQTDDEVARLNELLNEANRRANHANERLEICRKNYELCDKDRENALNQLAKLGEEINGPNGWKATCEVQRQTIAAYENGLTTPLSMPERSAYESRANEYRAELQRQLNEAWMRIDYKTADRIADLLGVQRPSDHEKEDLQPAAECGKPVKGVE